MFVSSQMKHDYERFKMGGLCTNGPADGPSKVLGDTGVGSAASCVLMELYALAPTAIFRAARPVSSACLL